MNKEEYFKIKDTLSLIKIAKENNSPEETITKNYVNYLSTNVNLMRESAKFEKERILKIIEEWEKKNQEVLTTDKLKKEKIIIADYVKWDKIKELKQAVLSGGSE